MSKNKIPQHALNAMNTPNSHGPNKYTHNTIGHTAWDSSRKGTYVRSKHGKLK